MVFENITENTWNPTGDYGSEFEMELNSYKAKVNDEITKLQGLKYKIDNHVSNSKLNEETVDSIDVCIRKLHFVSDEIDQAINSLEYL